MPIYAALFTPVLLTIRISRALQASLRKPDRAGYFIQPSIAKALPVAAVLGRSVARVVVHEGFEPAIPGAAMAFSAPAIVAASLTSLLPSCFLVKSFRTHNHGPSDGAPTIIISLVVGAAAICREVLLLRPCPDAADTSPIGHADVFY